MNKSKSKKSRRKNTLKKSIYDLAYKTCMKKGIIKNDCHNFLKLDLELKLKKCKTVKCKKFYRSKLKSLKKSKRKSRIKRRF